MGVIDTLVTDRTEADLTALAAALAAMNAGTATEQQAALAADPAAKGAYNYTDLNRVGTALHYLADLLNEYGYAVHVTAKRDWTEHDTPSPSQMAQYLADVSAIREAFAVPEGTPDVPESAEKLTWQAANAIETILQEIDVLLKNIAAAWFYSGELYAGEV